MLSIPRPGLLNVPTLPIAPPPTTLEAGRYVNGTRVEVVNGVPTMNPELYRLPSPGGTLGWNDLTISLYVV